MVPFFTLSRHPEQFPNHFRDFFFLSLRTEANLWYHYFELVLFQLKCFYRDHLANSNFCLIVVWHTNLMLLFLPNQATFINIKSHLVETSRTISKPFTMTGSSCSTQAICYMGIALGSALGIKLFCLSR